MLKLFKNLFSKKVISLTRSNSLLSDIIPIGNNKVIWNTLQNDFALIDVFNSLSEVYAPISWQANQASKVQPKLIKKLANGKEKIIESHEILDLINFPNELMGFNELMRQLFASYFLFGNSYLHSFVPIGKKPIKLFLLPTQYVSIKVEGDGNTTDFRFENITKYILQYANGLSFDKKDILHLKDINFNFSNYRYLYGMSSILSAQKPITSLQSAYSAKVSLYQNGPKVVLTGTGTTSDYLAPTDDDVSKVQDNFRKYGLLEDQYQYLITQFPFTVNKISPNIRELQINENNESDLRAICSTQGISSIIFNDNSSATFNNKKEAMKQAWEGKIKSTVDAIYNDFSNWIMQWWPNDGLVLKPDYSEIPELQNDINSLHNRLIQALDRGAITINEYREYMGFDIDNSNKMLNEYSRQGNWTVINETSNIEDNAI